MSFSNATETTIAAKIFTATAISWDAATELDIHLHTADPGETGASTLNEASYGSYALVTVNRDATAWTVSGNTTTNDNDIVFPQCTSGSNTLTHFSITPEGSTEILVSGTINNIAVSTGIRPQIDANGLTITFN